MRSVTTLFILLFLLCGSSLLSAQESLSQEEIEKLPHISAMQAYALHSKGEILLLDVHDGRDRSQILGAYFIPARKLKSMKLKIPKDQLVGVFCD